MSRHDLTDTEWKATRKYLPEERSGTPGRPWAEHRKIINGIMWILRVGDPWRDIPDRYEK